MNKQTIVNLLMSNDKAIARAVVVLNERQTADEQRSEDTRYLNGEGFTPADARMGSSMAKFFTARGYLTEKQLAYWKKPNKNGTWRICKYAGQLLEIAKAKAQAARMCEPAEAKCDIGDVGNLCEEMMALEEQYVDMLDSQDEELLNRIEGRMMQIKEQLEEIKRCEFKMKLDMA